MFNMRKLLLLLFISAMLPLASQAQFGKNDKVEKAKKLYTNLRLSLLNLFVGRLSGQYEMQIGKSSLNLTGNVSFTDKKPGYLVGLGYRYYFSSRRTSTFIGVVANFADYKKEYTNQTIDTGVPNATTTGDFRLWGQTITAGVNIGHRISILRIFNITGRIGYGYPIQINDLTWQGQGDQAPVDGNTLKQNYLLTSGIDAELSFGFHFGK